MLINMGKTYVFTKIFKHETSILKKKKQSDLMTRISTLKKGSLLLEQNQWIQILKFLSVSLQKEKQQDARKSMEVKRCEKNMAIKIQTN